MHKKVKYSDILQDSVFVCQTDTIYGLCTSAFNTENVDYIYSIKGRSENKPFIILISDTSDLKQFGITLSLKQKKFLEKVWPGKVSVVLPCTLKKFEYLHRGTQSLAFRLPKKQSIRDILDITGPLVAPSVNRQGEQPAETVTEAKEMFGEQIDLYISGGKLKGLPSTLISFTDDSVVCLREGAVPFAEIESLFEK